MARIVPAGNQVQAQSGDRSSGGTPPNFTGVGRLNNTIRHRMEIAFRADFSDVNIHFHSPGPQLVNARAYTIGEEIHFAPGHYDPHSNAGRELLGHELAHVVQQRQGHVRLQIPEGMVEINDQELASEADSIGERAASG